MLALVLRKQYPNLHCYAFGTPGSIVDNRTAKGTKLGFSLYIPLPAVVFNKPAVTARVSFWW
jgi:hypothetical protein